VHPEWSVKSRLLRQLRFWGSSDELLVHLMYLSEKGFRADRTDRTDPQAVGVDFALDHLLVDASNSRCESIVRPWIGTFVPATHHQDSREPLLKTSQIEALGKDDRSGDAYDVGIRRVFGMNLADIVRPGVGAGLSCQNQNLGRTILAALEHDYFFRVMNILS